MKRTSTCSKFKHARIALALRPKLREETRPRNTQEKNTFSWALRGEKGVGGDSVVYGVTLLVRRSISGEGIKGPPAGNTNLFAKN